MTEFDVLITAQQIGLANLTWLRFKPLASLLLFNADYTKKPTYSGVLQGLKGQSN